MTYSAGDSSSTGGYFTPDQLRSTYEEGNAGRGRTFEKLLNKTDKRYGEGSTDAVRRQLSPTSSTPASASSKTQSQGSARGKAQSAAGKAKAAANKASTSKDKPTQAQSRPAAKGSKATGTAKSAAGRARRPTK